MKLKHLFKRPQPERKPLYEAIVAAARQPVTYQSCGIQDTTEQRLALLTLFLALAVARLGGSHKPEAQDLVETFVADIEGNLRELGISDVAIPRHMREVEARYVNSLRDFRQALVTDNASSLVPVVQRFTAATKPETLATILHRTWRRLAALPPAAILAGEGFEHEEAN